MVGRMVAMMSNLGQVSSLKKGIGIGRKKEDLEIGGRSKEVEALQLVCVHDAKAFVHFRLERK
jgi:hypothetical protein